MEQPFGITDDTQARWLKAKLTPHPVRAFIDPLRLMNTEPRVSARTFILCSKADPAWTSAARVQAEPGWRYEELSTGHDAMVTAPRELVDLLLALVTQP